MTQKSGYYDYFDDEYDDDFYDHYQCNECNGWGVVWYSRFDCDWCPWCNYGTM